MNTFSSARIVVMVCVICIAHHAGHAEERATALIFSNVKYIEEAGDLAGYELEFRSDSPRVAGVLRIYQGVCGYPVPLSGANIAGKLHLRGESQIYGNVEIRGSLGGNLLQATLRIQKAVKTETLQLKAIPKPHC